MQLKPWQKSLPTLITFSRVVLMPFIIAAMLPQSSLWSFVAAFLFIIASLTDYFDGFYARKWNLVSNWGKFMDPIADKVLVTGILVMLLHQNRIDPFAVIILLSRDTFIGGIRSIAAADNVIIDAKQAGKWKTALQMICIPALMLEGEGGFFSIAAKVGFAALWVSVVLSLTSGWDYYRAYLAGTKKNQNKTA